MDTKIFKGKNVLVTGGAGFVGVNLINRLLNLNANIRATLYKKKAVICNNRIEYVWSDLRYPEDCKRVMDSMDYVFICSANTSGAAVIEKNPLAHLTPNVMMNVSILEAAYNAGVSKALFISSNTVYPLTDYPVKEDDVTDDFYEKYFIVAWMKRFSELVCEMYATKIKNPLTIVVVRPANIYGEHDDFEWETSHVIPALIRKVVERHDPIEIWGDGNDIKEFIYIDDFVDGMILSMEKIDHFQPINIAAGKPCSIKELMQIVIDADGFKNANLIYNTSKPTMIPKRMLDISLAQKLLDFQAKTGMYEGIKKTISWYRKTQYSK